MLQRHEDDEHAMFRGAVRRFVETEIRDHIEVWEEAEAFPRDLYRKAGDAGLLGLGFPVEHGGVPGDSDHHLILIEELARAGSGGLIAGLLSHGIAMPPVVAFGSEALKHRIVPDVLSGSKIAALAVTEPEAGSDVANLRTTATRDGDHYVLRGTKTFITSGMRADVVTVAARTGGPGFGGLSLLVVDGQTPGLARTPLKKMGWWWSDTATLYFDDCRVPAENLVGQENHGFAALMHNFNRERLGIASVAYGLSQVCLDEAVEYARHRSTFGKPLLHRQVIRHKLVDMASKILALRALVETIGKRVDAGEWPIAAVCMLKNNATQCIEFCAREAVQIFGGAGYMRGCKVERIYRETKVLAIGGGAEEVMKDLAAKQLGW